MIGSQPILQTLQTVQTREKVRVDEKIRPKQTQQTLQTVEPKKRLGIQQRLALNQTGQTNPCKSVIRPKPILQTLRKQKIRESVKNSNENLATIQYVKI